MRRTPQWKPRIGLTWPRVVVPGLSRVAQPDYRFRAQTNYSTSYALCSYTKCPMEYTISVHTVVETPQYLKASESIFSEAGREDIVAAIASEPEAGNCHTRNRWLS